MTLSARKLSIGGSSDEEVAMMTYRDSRQEFVHRELEILAKKLPNLKMELVEMKGCPDWDCVPNMSVSNYPVMTQTNPTQKVLIKTNPSSFATLDRLGGGMEIPKSSR